MSGAGSQVAEIQRARILAAMVEECCERGVGSVSVAHVVARSGVSRRTFYELFSGREDCLLVAFDDGVARAAREVIPAYEHAGPARSAPVWRERIRAALVALLGFLEREPAYARFLLVESLGAGETMLERRGRVIARLTKAVAEGHKESKHATVLSPLATEGVVGGVLSVLQGRLLGATRTKESKPAGLLELTNPLMSTIVLPFLGSTAARRELARPVPAPSVPVDGARMLSDPFKDAGMRLTYRTLRVLMAVADHPDASNRTIGETAGITDQGQISKLLSRLERTGMVCNTGLPPGQGAPNAWTLTSSGQQVIDSIRAHTEGPRTRQGTGQTGRER